MVQPASPNIRRVIPAGAAYTAVATLKGGIAWVQNIGEHASSGNLEVIVAASAPLDAAAGTVVTPGHAVTVLDDAGTGVVYVKSANETSLCDVEIRFAGQKIVNNLA
ncbi:hypothetical protein [Stappia phage SI01]|uniref:Uncharacterized protein n=1 Tax=Stappia phage SI01 TaxID=2847766 RepID=A0AAE7SPY9_9CAUD|nr:hypothetical protein [Stappia phage SI01]